MKSFKTSGKGPNSIKFELDGEVYKFKYPPLTSLFDIVSSEDGSSLRQLQALFDWTWQGLRGNGAERLKARIADLDDAFDEIELLKVANWLMGRLGKELEKVDTTSMVETTDDDDDE